MQVGKVDSVLRERYDTRIWKYSPGMRHEQQEDDYIEDQDVKSTPQCVMQPSVHDKPPERTLNLWTIYQKKIAKCL